MYVPYKRLLTLFLSVCLVLGFAFCRAGSASADDTVIAKILTTLSATPVALDDPSQLTVATSTTGLSIVSAGWFDGSGRAVTGAFGTETYRLEILVSANSGYVIAGDVAAYLNNSAVSVTVDGTGKTAVLTREYTAAVWAPTVYKSPGDETVEEGGWASFVVSASYARDYQWYLENPDGAVKIAADDARQTFPVLEVTGNGSSKLFLYHIPYELDGWKVFCNFIGAGTGNSVRSQGALVTVIPEPGRVTETPEPSPSPADEAAEAERAAAEAAAAASAAAAPSPAVSVPEPEPLIPRFSDRWSSDARSHWHASETDDSITDLEKHSFVWSEDEDTGIETGVCEVCGHTVKKAPAAEKSASGSKNEGKGAGKDAAKEKDRVKPGTKMLALLALAPVDVGLTAIHAVRAGRKKRRRRKR